MTKLCLVGYGKMGEMIARLSASKNCEVVSIIDPHSANAFSKICQEAIVEADVCVEFSHPSAVLENLERLIALKCNVVAGTTGWHQELPRIKALALEHQIGFIYGANFSIGMNIFSRMLKQAVHIADNFEDYDLFAYEMHHAQKADSPSGTARELAEIILQNSSRKTEVVYDRLERKPEAHELHFASIRGGKIPGTHVVGFDSEADTIELSHVVRSRSTFALGALTAAKWICGKTGVFSFSEMIEDILC